MRWIFTLLMYLNLSFIHAATYPVPADPPAPPFMGSLLPIVLVNDTGLPDSEVYVVVLGQLITPAGTQAFMQFDPAGVGTLVTATPGQNASDFTQSLDQFPLGSTGRVFYSPLISSGIIYFSLSSPLSMTVNAPNNIIQPSFVNPTDPNYGTIFDIFEYTYVNTGTNIVADATAVSFFALPLYGYISTPDVNTQPNTGLYQPRDAILEEVNTVFSTAPTATEWKQLFLRSNTEILRVLSTGKAMTAGPPPLFNPNYLDDLAEYGYSYIEDIWTGPKSFYRQHSLVMTIPAGSGETYTGVINSDNTITFTSAPSGYQVIFSAPSTDTSSANSTTEAIFFANPLISFDNSGSGDGIQVSKLFEEAIIAGLVPTTATLSNPYLLSNQANFYQINSNLSTIGQTTGPWYDLYSKALHSLGSIYTYGFDEPLWPDVQISTQTFQPGVTYMGITIGPVSSSTLFTTTTLTSSLNPAAIDTPVTFTAIVSDSSIPGGITGTITFNIDGVPGSAIPIVNDQAVYSTSSLTTGYHTVIAVYSGDALHHSSSSFPLSQEITASEDATTTTLISSLNPSMITESVTFTATVTSNSGTETPTGSIVFSIDNVAQPSVNLVNGQATFSTSSLSIGNHTIEAVYSGDSTNLPSNSNQVIQVVASPNISVTHTTLTSSPNPSVFGQIVTFTATVTSSPGFAEATGSITFSIDGVFQPAIPLVNAQATLQTSSLSVGNHTIIAIYTGDSSHIPSRSTRFTQVVTSATKTTSKTTLISSSNPAPIGGTIAFTATVTGTSGFPEPIGIVRFIIDQTILSPAIPLVNGQATFQTSTLTPGIHKVIAVYSGDDNHLPSRSTILTEILIPADRIASVTTITSSENPSLVGFPVIFTATVSGSASTPTGVVRFLIDSSTLSEPISLINGVATFSTSSLTTGNHTVDAVYLGNLNYFPSHSGNLNQVVTSFNEAATVTTINSSQNPSFLGSLVTFTAVVSSRPGFAIATGSITFVIDDVFQPPIPLVNGQASLQTSSLSVGNHTIVAIYTGDSTHIPSKSTRFTQTVTSDAVTTSVTRLSSSNNPSKPGQSVSFTAKVSGPSGFPAPTGNVQFLIDSTTLTSPIPLVNGEATFSIATLSEGAHKIVAIYLGDASHLGSRALVTQVVRTKKNHCGCHKSRHSTSNSK